MFGGLGQWLGNAADQVGTALNLPDIGLSEFLAGGKTQNTGRVPINDMFGTATGLTNGGTTQAPQPSTPSAAPDTNNIATTTTNRNGVTYNAGGTSTAAVKPTPSAAQLNPLLASLSSLDTILGNKNAQSQDEHDRAINGYNAQDALDSQAHDQQVHTNEQNLTANDQKALLNAANGASGLKGVLSSLGALAGSGVDAVHRLVGLAANADSGDARKTFDANATDLNQAWGQTTQQEKQRRDDADATLNNNMQNNKADVLNSRQSIYQQLANLWGAGTAEGDNYASQASALAPEIAATTKASVAPYAAASSLFTPQTLQNYLAGTKNLNVGTTPGSTTAPADTTPINSPSYAPQKKDQLSGVA